MLPCKKQATSAYATRYLKRAEKLARSITADSGRKRNIIDGCIVQGSKVQSMLTALSLELPSQIGFARMSFFAYQRKPGWMESAEATFPCRTRMTTARDGYNPVSKEAPTLITRLYRGYWFERNVVLQKGTSAPVYCSFPLTKQSASVGEGKMPSNPAYYKSERFFYTASLINNADLPEEGVWISIQRYRDTDVPPEFFTIASNYLEATLSGYTLFPENAAFYSSMKMIEINDTDFVLVTTVQRKIWEKDEASLVDSKLVMIKISTADREFPTISMDLFPDSLYPDGMREDIAYKTNGVYTNVDLDRIEDIELFDKAIGLMRVDDIEVTETGNVQVAIKLMAAVPDPDLLPSQQTTYTAISFGLASWGAGGASFYTEHSRDIDGNEPALVSEHGYSPELYMFGDRQVIINGSVYRWGIPAPRRMRGIDALWPTSLRPYIVELKDGIPTGITGDDEGTTLLAFGSSFDSEDPDDPYSELVFFDSQYNPISGVNALRNRFSFSRDFARDSMCGEKAVLSDTCVAIPAGGAIIPYAEYQTYAGETDVFGALSFRSSSAGLTFIDGDKRKYEKIVDTEDFSPYGHIGEALKRSIDFHIGYIMYVDCYQREVRDDEGKLVCPSGILVTLMAPPSEWFKDVYGNMQAYAKLYVRSGPIWPEDENSEPGQTVDHSSYWREINMVDEMTGLLGTNGLVMMHNRLMHKAFFFGWPYPLRGNQNLFMGEAKKP